MGLTKNDLEIINEALQTAKQKVNDYSGYPSYEYKQERLKDISDVIKKIREMKGESK